jgi:O-antigen polymerase
MLSTVLYSYQLYEGTKLAKAISFVFAVTCLLWYKITDGERLMFKWDGISTLILIFAVYVLGPPLVINRFMIFEIGYLSNFSLFVLYFLLLNIFRRRENRITILTYLFFLTVVLSGYGFFQIVGLVHPFSGTFSVSGTYTNPGPYACLLSLLVIVPLGLLFAINSNLFELDRRVLKNSTLCELTCYILILMCSVVLLYTGIRTAWLSVTLAGCCIGYRWLRSRGSSDKSSDKTTAATILIAIVALAGYLGFFIKKESSLGRLFIWKTAIAENRHPFLGNGYSYFERSYNLLQRNYFVKHPDPNSLEARLSGNVSYCYNELVETWVNFGLLGIVLVILICYFLVKGYIKHVKDKDPIFHLSYLGIMSTAIVSLTSYPFSMLGYKMIVVTYLALFVTHTNEESQPCYFRRTPFLVGGFCIMGLLATAAWMNYDSYLRWSLADTQFKIYKQPKPALDILDERDYALRYNGRYLQYYGRLLFLSARYNDAVTVLERAKNQISDPVLYYTLGQAYSAMEMPDSSSRNFYTSIMIQPNKLYPRYLLLQEYISKKYWEKANEAARQILAIRPKVHSPATEEIQKVARNYLLRSHD